MLDRAFTAWLRASGACVGLALCCLSGTLSQAQPAARSTGDTTVTLADGSALHGLKAANAGTFFRGIPYAAPPIGELRWQPPQPAKPWQGAREATHSAAACLQAFVGWNRTDAERGSEDCLYLDIHTPRADPQARLPVLVWIHGGANWAGSGRWIADSGLAGRGVVVVAVQYRLGIFGFLSHPGLTHESPHGASGNYALLDQIAALQWVRGHIAAFGGDPDSITLAGDSAGGQDVGLLMLSPLARGLFARAIQQSGTAGFGLPPRSLAENEHLGEVFAGLAGAGTAPDPIAALRSIPARRLLDAQMLLQSPTLADGSYYFLQPVVDGWVLPASPEQLLATGKQAPVPLLIGNVAQELTLNDGDSSSRRAIARGFGSAAATAFALYGLRDGLEPPSDPILGSTAMQVAADLTFRCPANITADAQSALGQPVWRYQMARAAPGAERIAHGAELPFVLDGLPLDPDIDGAHPAMQSYWVNFIRTGNPNGEGLPQWPRYGPDKSYIALTAHGPAAGRALRSQICSLLHRP